MCPVALPPYHPRNPCSVVVHSFLTFVREMNAVATIPLRSLHRPTSRPVAYATPAAPVHNTSRTQRSTRVPVLSTAPRLADPLANERPHATSPPMAPPPKAASSNGGNRSTNRFSAMQSLAAEQDTDIADELARGGCPSLRELHRRRGRACVWSGYRDMYLRAG